MSKIHDLMRWNQSSPVSVRKGSSNFSLTGLQEEMNRLFDHFYNGAQVRLTDWDRNLPSMPSVNLIESGDSFKVEAELAGMDPKNVEVEIADGCLTLKGERREEKEEKKEGGNYLRREIFYGSFSRTIALPETVDSEKAEAAFKNGILTVSLPKKAEARQKPKKVEIRTAA